MNFRFAELETVKLTVSKFSNSFFSCNFCPKVWRFPTRYPEPPSSSVNCGLPFVAIVYCNSLRLHENANWWIIRSQGRIKKFTAFRGLSNSLVQWYTVIISLSSGLVAISKTMQSVKDSSRVHTFYRRHYTIDGTSYMACVCLSLCLSVRLSLSVTSRCSVFYPRRIWKARSPFFLLANFSLPNFPVAHFHVTQFSGCPIFRCCFIRCPFSVAVISDINFLLPFVFLCIISCCPDFRAVQFSGRL